jgi:hypothetical protein
VEVYGWKEDLQDLANKGIADAQRPLLAEMEKKTAEKESKATDAVLSLPKEGTEATEPKGKKKKNRQSKSMAATVAAEESEK